MSAVARDPVAARPRQAGPRPSGTVGLWATLGVAGVAWMCAVWIPWLASGDAAQPSPGGDVYDHLWVLRGTEVLSTAGFVGLLWWSLVRPLRSGAGLTLDGKLFLGGVVAASMDMMYGFLNPTWAMNAHAVSLGTWSEHIPAFGNPGEQHNAWGLLWCLPAYIWLGLGAALVGTWLLDQLRQRFPHTSTVAMYLIVLAVFYVVFAVVENLWLRTQVYTYVSVPEGLTLWSGETHQWPVYSPLLIGCYCLSYTWLRDSRDERGRCAVDRGVDSVRFGRNARQVISLLAVIGYTAATTIVAYQLPWTWLSMTDGSDKTTPALPSYLTPGVVCGQPDQPICASQYLDRLRHDPAGLPTVPRDG